MEKITSLVAEYYRMTV